LKHVQGSLIDTHETSNFAIQGPGFFKILIDDKTIGYTRNGNFMLLPDETGNLRLTLWDGQAFWLLADEPIIYHIMIKDKDNNIIGTSATRNINSLNQQRDSYKTETVIELNGDKTAEQLKIYNVPYEILRHYRNGIYLTDENTSNAEENRESIVISKALEHSNVPILETIIRMYYLIQTDKNIKNRIFKAGLLKIGIERYMQQAETAPNGSFYQHIQSIVPFLSYEY
jgi:flagellar basal body rod protein FlgG